MIKICPKCERIIRSGELVELTIIAEYNELKSKIHFSVGTPLDCIAGTLQHHDCMGEAAE